LIGPSEYSNTLYVSLNKKPDIPLVPSRNEISTTKTQIAVTWLQVADGTGVGG